MPKCEYCNKEFKKESTLAVHVCEKKRRALSKNEKHVVIAFNTYVRFFKISTGNKRDKTFEEFCNSKFYSSFIKFGSFVNNVKPLYPDRFIDYVIRSNVKLDDWYSDELYEKYVIELIKTESADTALERAVVNMVKWGDENNANWQNYFEKVSALKATYDIKDGKISPWLILNSRTGKEMLNSLTDDQLNTISHVIDPVYWTNQFKRRKEDLSLVKQFVKEAGI